VSGYRNSGRRAVVTGGAGFLGTHLVAALLTAGWSVVVVDDFSSGSRDNLSFCDDDSALTVITADICAEWKVDEPVDVVFNFASPASPPQYLARPVQTLRAGAHGVSNVIDLAVRHGARLVQASTSEVYGDPAMHPQTEDYWGHVNPIGQRSVYDEAKRYAEALIAAHVRIGELDAGIVRIFNTYGPGMQPNDGRVIPNLIATAMTGAPMTVYGDGSQTRSFCYVDDLVIGVLAMAGLRGEPGPVNLGNPDEISILSLAGLIARLTGHSGGIEFCPLPSDDPVRRLPDIGRAARLLGWQPETDLTTGLHRTIEWFRNQRRAALVTFQASRSSVLRHVLQAGGEFLPGFRAATGNLGDSLRAVQRNGADQLLPVRRAHRVQGQ
jgi:nucleoside-diphosphate-sugar epimerase